tara:strand:+ start:284 stop:601 length:318 start_codon:yes stop_codon:yes gene_type:complete
MSKKLKFYVAHIEERYGEFEVYQSLLLNLPEDEDPDKYMEEYNRDWYGQECTEADEDEDGWIENDWMMHRAARVAEISESCFDELVKTDALRGRSIGVFEEEDNT